MKRAPKTKRKGMSRHITKNGRLLGGYMPASLANAIDVWVSADPERDKSKFLRQAAREKLQRDGITFDERVPAETI